MEERYRWFDLVGRASRSVWACSMAALLISPFLRAPFATDRVLERMAVHKPAPCHAMDILNRWGTSPIGRIGASPGPRAIRPVRRSWSSLPSHGAFYTES